jgi:hypothetical protein
VAAYGIEEVAVLLGLLTDGDLEELELATQLTAYGSITLSPASTELTEAGFFAGEGLAQGFGLGEGATSSVTLEVRPAVVDDCALQVEGQLGLLLALRRRLYGYGLAFVEDTREGRTAVGFFRCKLRRLTTLTTSEEGRATGEAIDVDLPLGSEAVTDEDPPAFALVIGEQIVVVGGVVRHAEERRLEEAITLLGEARHIEVIATEACGRAASEEERHTILEEEGRADRRIGLQRLGRYPLTLPATACLSVPSESMSIGDDAIAPQRIDEAEDGEDGRCRLQAVAYYGRLHGEEGADISGELLSDEEAPTALREELGYAINPDECAIDDAELIGCAIHTLGTCYLPLQHRDAVGHSLTAALEAGDVLGERRRGRTELIGVIGTLRLTEELLGALRGSLRLHDLRLTPYWGEDEGGEK